MIYEQALSNSRLLEQHKFANVKRKFWSEIVCSFVFFSRAFDRSEDQPHQI